MLTRSFFSCANSWTISFTKSLVPPGSRSTLRFHSNAWDTGCRQIIYIGWSKVAKQMVDEWIAKQLWSVVPNDPTVIITAKNTEVCGWPFKGLKNKQSSVWDPLIHIIYSKLIATKSLLSISCSLIVLHSLTVEFPTILENWDRTPCKPVAFAKICESPFQGMI